jgi:hypothetical protein
MDAALNASEAARPFGTAGVVGGHHHFRPEAKRIGPATWSSLHGAAPSGLPALAPSPAVVTS